jgi:CheY-like chemotaxis protein
MSSSIQKANKGKTILVCDDDDSILEVTSIFLESEGYEVVQLKDCDRFFECLARAKPDLILLDIWMPQITGDALARMIKSDEKIRHIPVLLFSANGDVEKVAKEAGADGYLKKPFDLTELGRVIDKQINHKK